MFGFVYCWTDHKEKKLYIGVHKGTIDDGYICSSKLVKSLINERSIDFTRQIISVGDYFMMRKLETKILQSVNAKKNPAFYNMHNADGSTWYLKQHTLEAKKKISDSKLGKKRPDVTYKNTYDNPGKHRIWKKGDNAGPKNPMFGKKHREESKNKMSANRVGLYKGVRKTAETRKAMSDAAKLLWARRKNKIVPN